MDQNREQGMEPAALQTQQAGRPSIPPIPQQQQGDADPPPLLASGRDWAFRLVRGSVYVAGERVESMARDGRRAVEMAAAAAAAAAGASGGLTPGMLRRAASDRELRDGRHFHITLLHRSEVGGAPPPPSSSSAPAAPEPPSLQEASQFVSSFGASSGDNNDGNVDNAAAAKGAVASTTDNRINAAGSEEPAVGWAALRRARGGASGGGNNGAAAAANGVVLAAAVTAEQGQGQRQLWWGGERGVSILASLSFLPSSPAAASAETTAAKAAGAVAAMEEAEADEEAQRRLGELLAPFHGSALAGMLEAEEAAEGEGGGVLSDPLPLYVYRTSGEGKALAVALLFLPGEFLRFAHGQPYRPLHTTLGFLGTDERDLDARKLGNVQVLAFCQPPATVRRALLGLCRLLRRMRARLRESGGNDDDYDEVRGFLPRVVELGMEVKVVAELMGLAVGEEEDRALLVELEESKEG